jgi:hypothetical protein
MKVADILRTLANTVTMYWQGSSDNSMNLLTSNKLKATTRLIGSVNYATV